MRKDVPIATLIFETTYVDNPGQPMAFEVARLYTTIAHVKRMIEVLSKNVAAYEEQMGLLDAEPKADGAM
ncbi:MAG TPA: DUF3467 domain-containing protein [Phycisphaerales bacterium]|nr:DUF3467 domain-containing protein [Phycisphaerales bacterium]